MAQELSASQAGEGASGGGVNCVRPQDLQNMRLVIDVGDGKTIEIPLTGYLTLNNCGRPSQGTAKRTPIKAAGAAGEQADLEHQSSGHALPGHPAAEPPMEQDESKYAEHAREYLNNMRGWVVTVATLFISMSFQALSQRPSWMADPKDGLDLLLNRFKPSRVFKPGKNSLNPAEKEAFEAIQFVFRNTLLFSMSLVMVVLLFLPNISTPKRVLNAVGTMMICLASMVAVNFASAISKEVRIWKFVITVMAIYGFTTALFWVMLDKLADHFCKIKRALPFLGWYPRRLSFMPSISD